MFDDLIIIVFSLMFLSAVSIYKIQRFNEIVLQTEARIPLKTYTESRALLKPNSTVRTVTGPQVGSPLPSQVASPLLETTGFGPPAGQGNKLIWWTRVTSVWECGHSIPLIFLCPPRFQDDTCIFFLHKTLLKFLCLCHQNQRSNFYYRKYNQ